MKLVTVFTFACFVLYSEAKPTDEATQTGNLDSVLNIPECHGVSCPAGTTSCLTTEIGEKTIHCLNAKGEILHSAPCPYELGQHGQNGQNGHHGHQGHHGHH